jgi:hypothetical protein
MRYILLLLVFSTEVLADYEFEKSKYFEGITCKEMVGTWFTDVSVENQDEGAYRHITKIVRKSDGKAYLKGLSINIGTGEISPWEFPSTWSCKNYWYVEKNEWGYTAFRIKAFGATQNILVDELKNLRAESAIRVLELKSLNLEDRLYQNQRIRNYFGF